MKLIAKIKERIHGRLKLKKTIGVVLIFLGLIALITPFTPGSWLAFIGLELLGIRLVFQERIKKWRDKTRKNSLNLHD